MKTSNAKRRSWKRSKNLLISVKNSGFVSSPTPTTSTLASEVSTSETPPCDEFSEDLIDSSLAFAAWSSAAPGRSGRRSSNKFDGILKSNVNEPNSICPIWCVEMTLKNPKFSSLEAYLLITVGM